MCVVTRHERMLLLLLLVLILLTHGSLGYLPFRWDQLNFTDCKVRNPSEGDVDTDACKFSSSGRSMKPKDEWITQISTSYVKSVFVTSDIPWYFLTLELDGNACRPFALIPGMFICHEIGSKITVKLDKEEREENKGWILKDVNAIGEKLKEGEVRVRVKDSHRNAWYYGDCIDPWAFGMPPTLVAWRIGPQQFMHFYVVQLKRRLPIVSVGARTTSFAPEVRMWSWTSPDPANLGSVKCAASARIANLLKRSTQSENSSWRVCSEESSAGLHTRDTRSRLFDVPCIREAHSVQLKFLTYTENVVFLYEVFVVRSTGDQK